MVTYRLQVSHHIEDDEVVKKIEEGRDGPLERTKEGSSGGTPQISEWTSIWGRQKKPTFSQSHTDRRTHTHVLTDYLGQRPRLPQPNRRAVSAAQPRGWWMQGRNHTCFLQSDQKKLNITFTNMPTSQQNSNLGINYNITQHCFYFFTNGPVKQSQPFLGRVLTQQVLLTQPVKPVAASFVFEWLSCHRSVDLCHKND